MEKGAIVERVAWCDESINWAEFDCGLITSTWDYYERYEEFMDWLSFIEDKTPLINTASTIKWNIDKHYLAELSTATVPSYFVNKGEAADLPQVFDEIGCLNAVIKPTISASGSNTFKVNKDDIAAFSSKFAELSAEKDMLIQPFQNAIIEEGEKSLIVINGQYTHAIRKTAADGEFRIQGQHGGTVHNFTPKKAEISFAEDAVKKCGYSPLYARVDIINDNDDQTALMELELIEPDLFFRYNKAAATSLAKAVLESLQG